MIKTYENLCQMLEKEICSIEQAKGLTKDSVELLKCLTETINNLKDLIEKENNMNRGMSNYTPHYEMSGAQRRDSMGRYMDAPMMNSYDKGYSRDDSRKKMVRKLETLMDDTMSEYERSAIKNCINQIEQQ